MAKGNKSGFEKVSLKMDFAAPPRVVWRGLVQDQAKWWPKEFATDPRYKQIVLESEVGGRWYEDWGGGRGRLWHTVITLDPPHLLESAGPLFPQFGGPAITMLRVELEARGKGTRMRVTDTIFGRVDKGTRKSFEKGWEALLDALKSHLQKKQWKKKSKRASA